MNETLARALDAGRHAEWSRKAAEEVISFCRQGVEILLETRRTSEESWTKGAEVKSFISTYEPVVASMGEWKLSADESIWQDLAAQIPPSLAHEFFAALKAFQAEATQLHTALGAALAKAKAQPGPVNWDKVRAAEADWNAERCENIREVLNRLQAGGEI
jgi:hypothetical protein